MCIYVYVCIYTYIYIYICIYILYIERERERERERDVRLYLPAGRPQGRGRFQDHPGDHQPYDGVQALQE